jgi:hypothetical protein
MKCSLRWHLAYGIALLLPLAGGAALDVFLDFTTDAHDGAGTVGANGVADWQEELVELASSVGMAPFGSAERTQIENEILSQLSTIYAEYEVNLTTTAPTSGDFDTIYMGFDDDSAGLGGGVLGFAPVDIGNLFANQITNVIPANFGFILESFEPVAMQIAELATALAGTAAHELGHSLGLLHHHAYSDSGITPATYGSTGGLQNQYVIATGSTGLGEAGREVLRSFSPWERALLDVAGSASPVFGTDGPPITANPVTVDASEAGIPGFDAGGSIATALPLSFEEGATSGFDLAAVIGDLDGSSGDVDTFSLEATAAGTLVAEVFSDLRFAGGDDFDPFLELLDQSGTVLAANDSVFYSGNTYDSGSERSIDPFLLNIPLASAGTYYLRVSESSSPQLTGEAGNAYILLAGVNLVPEPATLPVLLLAAAPLFLRRPLF